MLRKCIERAKCISSSTCIVITSTIVGACFSAPLVGCGSLMGAVVYLFKSKSLKCDALAAYAESHGCKPFQPYNDGYQGCGNNYECPADFDKNTLYTYKGDDSMNHNAAWYAGQGALWTAVVITSLGALKGFCYGVKIVLSRTPRESKEEAKIVPVMPTPIANNPTTLFTKPITPDTKDPEIYVVRVSEDEEGNEIQEYIGLDKRAIG